MVANKIAAGEVIERPASVVKELLENAIDAASTDIRVEIRGGGLQLIRVMDDGLGIPADEVALCFQRHATSKIHSVEELFSIHTLGFRGEALPSIGAVARVSVLSRQPGEETGVVVEVEGGRVIQEGPRGCAPGTVVSVHDLFANVPARLKFLKAAGTEMAHVSQIVSQFALAYPELRFTLINEGRLAFQSAGDANLLAVLMKVYGINTADGMLALDSGGDALGERGASRHHVDGYVSQPNITRSNRNCISFFVNRRWVQSRTLAYAVEEAYHPFLAPGRHPVAAINISLPPDEVDVNVHPQKTEVRFMREREVFALIQRAVRRVISENFSMPSVVNRPDIVLPEVQRRLELVDQQREPLPRYAPLPRVEAPPLGTGAWAHRGLTVENHEEIGPLPALEERAQPPAAAGASILRVIGQMGNTFIIAEGPSGMYLVDQHRAHERVIFERLEEERASATRDARSPDSQALLEPLTVELSLQQAEVVHRRLDFMAGMGFAIEAFGERTYLIRAVPAVLAQPNVGELVREIMDQAAEEHENGDWQREIIASMACKGAIKAGQVLSLVEMRELIVQLESTKLPPKCPHGAPTMVHLSQAQLEKQFGR